MLEGLTGFVTGASGGIGAEIAVVLADHGANVALAARSEEGLRETAARIDDEDRTLVVTCDVSEEASVEEAIDACVDEFGGLDILVNNAGIGGPSAPLPDTSSDEFDRVMAVNVRGPTLVTKYALPLLLAHEGARVVNLSSGMGALGEAQSGGSAAYRISKTAINGLTAYLNGEYGDQGLLANSVCPGWVRTDMGGDSARLSVEEGAETPTWLCRFEPGSPAGRFWRSKEIIDW